MKRVFLASFTLGFALVCAAAAAAQSADPLPSWNDGEVKKAIVQFVTGASTKGGLNFVPPEQRIATFDNDGTLWSEQPVVQGMFLVYQLERMAEKGPSLQLLVNHDDETREFAYAEADSASINAVNASDLLLVSMKNDWESIFPASEM